MASALARELRGLGAAVRFLTCLPIPGGLPTADDLGRALRYFPLVGLALGGALVGLDRLLGPWLARPLLDFALLGALVILSGALHLDGLIDAADGLLSPGPTARRLARMRESGAGPRGAAAALALLLLQYAALSALEPPARVPALLLAPLLGRWGILYGYTVFPYARSTLGISWALKQGGTHSAARCVTLVVLAVAGLLAWPAGPLLLVVAWAIAELIGRLARRRLGGMSGDVYGAVEQLVETMVLLLTPLATLPG